MRMRKKAWARPELAACPYFVQDPRGYRGHWQDFFARRQPLHLELGCGKGVFLAQIAPVCPQVNFIGVDLSPDVLGVARRNLQEHYAQAGRPADNIALTAFDIERILEMMDQQDTVERIYIHFCNPWPKMRHHKKRLTHTRQLALYQTFLQDGGELHFKTDDSGLYQSTLRYLRESGFEILWQTTDLYENGVVPQDNLVTEHELRFTAQGIAIKAIVARYCKQT